MFLKNIVRPGRVVIHYYFSMFTYKFSKHGGKRSLQTVKSFSSGFGEDQVTVMVMEYWKLILRNRQ